MSYQTNETYQTQEEEMYTKACQLSKTKMNSKESLENLLGA
jgi:hypothetical protein